MTHFFDSSALVKLYAAEHGSDEVAQVDGPRVVSAVARVEVPAALWRKQREGELDPDDAALLVRAFEADYAGAGDDVSMVVVDLTPHVLERAATAVAVHALRSLDAIQLASAVAARQALGEEIGMVTFDARLRAAAAAESFPLLPDRLVDQR